MRFRSVLAALFALMLAGEALALGEIDVRRSSKGGSVVEYSFTFDSGDSVNDTTEPIGVCPNMRVRFEQGSTGVGTFYGTSDTDDDPEANGVSLLTVSATSTEAETLTTGAMVVYFVIDTAETSGKSKAVVTCDHGVAGGGGGVGGDAVLYSAYMGASPQTQALSITATDIDFDWTENYDPASEWTATDDEICWTGTGSANVVVSAAVTLEPDTGTPDVGYYIGQGATGATAAGTTMTRADLSVGYGEPAAVIDSFELTDAANCLSVMIERQSGGATPTMTPMGGTIAVYAPGAEDNAWADGASTISARSSSKDISMGGGAVTVDVSAGTTTCTVVGCGFETRGNQSTGETWCFNESVDDGDTYQHCKIGPADLSANEQVRVDLPLLAWDSDTDATWGAAENPIDIGWQTTGGDQRLDDGINLIRIQFWDIDPNSATALYAYLLDDEGAQITEHTDLDDELRHSVQTGSNAMVIASGTTDVDYIRLTDGGNASTNFVGECVIHVRASPVLWECETWSTVTTSGPVLTYSSGIYNGTPTDPISGLSFVGGLTTETFDLTNARARVWYE